MTCDKNHRLDASERRALTDAHQVFVLPSLARRVGVRALFSSQSSSSSVNVLASSPSSSSPSSSSATLRSSSSSPSSSPSLSSPSPASSSSSPSTSPPAASSPAASSPSRLHIVSPATRRVSVNQARYYTVDGVAEPLPSVTSVLGVLNKPFLTAWKIRTSLDALVRLAGDRPSAEQLRAAHARSIGASSAIANRAAAVGTDVHELLDDMLLLDAAGRAALVAERAALESTSRARAVLACLERLERETRVQFTHQDTVVYSARHGYAGALDAVAVDDAGRLVVVDFKTSKAMQATFALQVAAYAAALTEMTGERVHEGWVVRVDIEKAHVQVRRVADLDGALDTFLAALRLFRETQSPLQSFLVPLEKRAK